MDILTYKPETPFVLETGGVIKDLKIAYNTFGTLNEKKDNVVWVCHALTANSNVPEWWGKVAGEEGLFKPKDYFIVCANILGSCYGSTSPLDINPETGEPYYDDFPFFTMRDIVRAHILLRQHLGIDKINVCIGGSCGGHQVMEFALMDPGVIDNLVLVVTSARETAWSIAIHTTQRMAMESDGTWGQKHPRAGEAGMKTARGIGLLTYRSHQAYVDKQTDDDPNVIDNFRASSYIKYQGEKLANRFNAYSYWHLTKALDTHHIGRGRGPIPEVLKSITSNTLVIGVDTDKLIPFTEQEYLAAHIPGARLGRIETPYGHDGFLMEQETVAALVKQHLNL